MGTRDAGRDLLRGATDPDETHRDGECPWACAATRTTERRGFEEHTLGFEDREGERARIFVVVYHGKGNIFFSRGYFDESREVAFRCRREVGCNWATVGNSPVQHE